MSVADDVNTDAAFLHVAVAPPAEALQPVCRQAAVLHTGTVVGQLQEVADSG